MAQIKSVIKALGTTHSLLVNALAPQYEHELWPLITTHVPQPEEGSPRAIILCKDDQQARAIHAQFIPLAKPLDLTVDLIVEKGNKLQQRNDLFDGTEIIVGTTRRMAELYFQNGFNIKKLKLFVILELDLHMRQGHKGYIVRMTESLPKCKVIFFSANADEERTLGYLDEFYPNIQQLELSEEA
jgi:superfamily II DNA/RNA helicase